MKNGAEHGRPPAGIGYTMEMYSNPARIGNHYAYTLNAPWLTLILCSQKLVEVVQPGVDE